MHHLFLRFGTDEVWNIDRGNLDDLTGSLLSSDVVYGTEYHIEIHHGEQCAKYQYGGKPFSGVRALQKERRRSSAASFILISISLIFISFVILSIRHPQVPVLHNPERLKDETVRIIVAACGV